MRDELTQRQTWTTAAMTGIDVLERAASWTAVARCDAMRGAVPPQRSNVVLARREKSVLRGEDGLVAVEAEDVRRGAQCNGNGRDACAEGGVYVHQVGLDGVCHHRCARVRWSVERRGW